MVTKERLTSILFLIVLLIYVNKPLLPLLEYYLFKDYIAKNLCVEREVENNSCKGCCHLEKQLEAVTESEKSSSEKPTSKKISVDQKEIALQFNNTVLIPNITIPYSYYHSQQIENITLLNVFVPPKFV